MSLPIPKFVLRPLAKYYQGLVNAKLREMGLRYEDIIIEENPDVQKALQYIPKEELVARNRRITRAIDLSFKHESLPKEIQNLQEPSKFYLKDLMAEFKALREEKDALRRGL